MKELNIFVPALPALQGYNHWADRMRSGRLYGNLVRAYALDAKHLWEREHSYRWEPLARARVTLEFIWPLNRRGPLPDLKNLEAAFKPGIDALTARGRGEDKDGYVIVGAGILEDDGPSHIEWQPTTLTRGPEPGVRITIVEIL